MQRPPAFSALKREGRAAYESARAGRPLELAPRPVTFHELRLLAFEPPEFEVFARVSRGTYLRALARDLGEALLCGGHLAALVRTRVGAFRLENAVSPEHLGELSAAGRAAEALIPARRAFPEMAMLVAADEGTRREVMWARPLPVERFSLEGERPAAGQSCLILDSEGRALFLAEAAADESGVLLVRPRKKLG